MKICFVGLGSIAKRHIKNIKSMYGDVMIDILRHSASGSANSDDAQYGNCVYSEEELADRYDAIFITNPTTMHIDSLYRLIDRSDSFFIEKPLRPIGCSETLIDSVSHTRFHDVEFKLTVLDAERDRQVVADNLITRLVHNLGDNGIDFAGHD